MAYLNLMEIDQAVQGNRARDMENQIRLRDLMRSQKQDADTEALKGAFRGAVGADGKYDLNKLLSGVSGVDAIKGFELSQTIDEKNAARLKAEREAKTANLDQQIKIGEFAVNEFARVIPNDNNSWQAAKQRAIAAGSEAAKSLPDVYDENAHRAFMETGKSWLEKAKPSSQEYVYQNTPDGIVQLGKKDGFKPRLVINPDTGKPFVASSASPELQGLISGARANANNQSDLGYKPKIRRAEAQVDLDTKPQIAQAESQAKEIGKTNAENLQLIPNAEDALTSVQAAKDLLTAGIYTGGYADIKQKIAKYTPMGDDQRLSNTEQFVSNIGNVVVPRLKEFGGNDSNEEMRYLKSIMGGDVSVQPETLSKILDSVEFKIKRGIQYKQQGLDANGKRIAPTSPNTPKGGLKNIITLPDGRKLGINAQGKAELVK